MRQLHCITELALTHKGFSLVSKVHTKIAEELLAVAQIAGTGFSTSVAIDPSELKHSGIQCFQKEKMKAKSSGGKKGKKEASSGAIKDTQKTILEALNMDDFMKNFEFGRFLGQYSEKIGRQYDNQAIYKGLAQEVIEI